MICGGTDREWSALEHQSALFGAERPSHPGSEPGMITPRDWGITWPTLSSTCSTSPRCRRSGTTSSRTCPEPPPPALHPGTHQPVGPDDLAPLFPMALIMQEVSTERYIDIPEEVLDIYRLWRPSPLYRARRLEKALDTPAQHLLQVRRRQPGRVAQAQHRRPAGLLQRPGGRQEAHHRDRRRPVGQRPRLRLRASSTSSARSGRCERRTTQKPLPQVDDGGLGRDRSPQPFAISPRPAAPSSPQDPDSPGSSRHRHLRGGRMAAAADPDDPLRPGQRPQPRAAAPDDHRRGSAAADEPRSARPPTCSSAAREAAPTSPASPSRSSARSWPAR